MRGGDRAAGGAASWFHQRGQIDTAIDHLLAAGAVDQAAQWLEDGFAEPGAPAAPATLTRWVSQLPKPVLRGRPRVATMAAWALIASGEVQAEPTFNLALDYLGRGLLRYEWNELGDAARHIEEALRRYEVTAAKTPEALLALARVRQTTGDHERARELVEQAGDLLASRPKLRAAAAAVWPDGVRVLLAQGDVAGARRWVQAAGVELDPQPDLWRSPEYFALARVLVAEGHPGATLPLLGALRGIAVSTGCRGIEAEGSKRLRSMDTARSVRQRPACRRPLN